MSPSRSRVELSRRSLLFLLFSFALSFLVNVSPANAAMLSRVSDTISTSWPSSTSTSHTILFTVPTTIPAGGEMSITPEASNGSSFDIPAALDYTDLDLAVEPVAEGVFTDRPLAATPSATEEGISVVSGVSGSITITLGSGTTSPIMAGSVVRIIIGGAPSGGSGDQYIVSPSAVGSYHIRLVTTDALGGQLDYGSTLIAIVAPITMGPIDNTDSVPPLRSNGLPAGLLPGSTSNVLVSLNTDKLAVCRYATSSGVTYAAMPYTFPSYNIGLLHYQSFAVTQNTVYNFYVRCINTSGHANPDDYLISFEVGVVPNNTPPPPPPPPSFGGGPSGVGGGGKTGGQFLQSGDVTVEGKAAPGSDLVILQDGKIVKEVTVGSLGNFSETFSGLERGTYTWGVYLRDANGKLSSTYTSTIYLVAGTNNIIAPIYLSPTLSAASTTITLGSPIQLSGYAIALVPVQVIMNKQGDALSGKIVTATTTANGNGSWALTLPTEGLSKGTYEVKVLSQLSGTEHSLLSPIVYIGLGEEPNPNFRARSDVNKDNKVNLTDLSILLFNWKTSDPAADINGDGIVNLTDFSILLVNWTG